MIIIDFETSYTARTPKGEQPHGLRTQTIPEYLHDPRTECLGAAVSIKRKTGYQRSWVAGDKLAQVLTLAASGNAGRVSCHNAAFDLSVWARFFPASYDVLRKRLRGEPMQLLDTLHLARYASSQGWLPHDVGVSIKALGEHYGLEKGDTEDAVAQGGEALADYAIRDVEIAERVVADFVHKWPPMEWELSTLHVLMSTPGPETLRVDAEVLREVATETDAERERAQWIRRDENFCTLLKMLDVLPQYKQTPSGKYKLACAKTDQFMRDLLAHKDKRVRQAAQLRLSAGSNINRTRAQRMLVSSGDGERPLPMSVDYYRAHTGRSGGSGGLNPQNMPRGGPHRRALVAPSGRKLVVCDASQIEVRVLAWLAGDEPTLEVFRRGGDPYKAFAVDLYGLDGEDAVTSEQRRVAKSAVLGLGFGAGPGGFLTYCEQMGVEIDAAESERVVQAYRRSKPAVTQYWQQLKRIERVGEQTLPSGRRMVYPDMDGETFQRPAPFAPKGLDTRSKYWHGLFCENAVQAVARDITLCEHSLRIAQVYPVVLVVHDEVVCSVPEQDAEQCLQYMQDVMNTAPEWAADLPLASEGDIADSYGEAK